VTLLREPALAESQVFPLPMYTTVPNEGPTYGVMPVFMGMAANENRIAWITAPSMSWNTFAGVTITARYFRYYGPLESWRLVGSVSSNINRSVWFQYDDDRRDVGHNTKNVLVRVRRSLFYRFFGLGPNTLKAGESSYTRVTGFGDVRWAWNITRNFNVGPFFEIRGDEPELHALPGLPPTQVVYPTAPGLGGALLMRQGISIRYDTREGADYAEHGFSSELLGSVAEGLSGFEVFGELIWHSRLLVRENSFMQLGSRLYVAQVFGGGQNVPFYYQPSLGGELLLRGFPEDRFIDKGAWEVEVEQRIRMFELHMFGVVSDWRIDPFVAAGQVYGLDAGPFSHMRFSVGAGLRAWVHPNVLGRIDVAWAGEGPQAYVVLGYPF
jgi:hypothetical protein